MAAALTVVNGLKTETATSSQAYLESNQVKETKNLITELCRQFYNLGWVSGTGGSITIKVHDDCIPKPQQLILMSPSGVQKERMVEEDMYVLSPTGSILFSPFPKPYPHKPPKCSDCAPLFMKAYEMRNAGAVIHSHGMESCIATMINPLAKEFRITHMEMIKGIQGHGYYDDLVVPIIENTAQERELTESLAAAIEAYPKSTAVLVRNHGVYIWGDTWISAKTQAECYHYLFEAAIKLHQLGLDCSTPNHGPIQSLKGLSNGDYNVNTSVKAGIAISNNEFEPSHHCIVLDIEGTTTPISFVTDVLFPYARGAARMKAQKGKHSEAFWPSVMVKKLLNIKPKVYEFSEDEIDTEAEGDTEADGDTEAETEDDVCFVKDMMHHVPGDQPRTRRGNLSESRSQTSGSLKDMLPHVPEDQPRTRRGNISESRSQTSGSVKDMLCHVPEDQPRTRQGNLSEFRSQTSGSVKDKRRHVAEDLHHKRQENHSESRSQTSGKPSKRPYIKHRRGNSETLRAQYINTKDVRVTIGTWNVAGRPPNEDLDIDEWLCMEEPSDIYILGFQEVVPLNAGNVLGAETRRPILQWESVIRRTLNKYIEPDPRQKSYSAPHSPVLWPSAAAADIDDTSELEMIAEESLSIGNASDSESQKLHGLIGLGNKFRLNRTYSIGRYSRLDWPEHPLDVTSQVLSSGVKLRRALSTSARVGSDWMENAQIFSYHNNAVRHGGQMRRVNQSLGNLGLMRMNPEDKSEFCGSVADLLDKCPEAEENSLEISEMEYENALLDDGVKSHLKYIRIVSKQMVGIYISVWVRRRLRKHINNLKVLPVGVGLMGYMGNKGSVSVSMSLFQTRLCFVCSHLTSGHKEGYEQRRNSDVHEIIRRTRFSSAFDAHQPLTIPSHDQVFWFGDLNYRVNMSDSEVRKLVSKKQWDELLNRDQLINELRNGVFDGWKEGPINFPPTYKYGINCDVYVGENRKEGEKKRSPAWCDRILWLGKGIKQLSYNRAEMWLSDHRPVSSAFLSTVEVLDHWKLRKALNVTSVVVHPDLHPEMFEEKD